MASLLLSLLPLLIPAAAVRGELGLLAGYASGSDVARFAAPVLSGTALGPLASATAATLSCPTSSGAVPEVRQQIVVAPSECPLGDVCTTGPCLITAGGSPDFPNDHPLGEGCTISNLSAVGLDVIAFDVECSSTSKAD